MTRYFLVALLLTSIALTQEPPTAPAEGATSQSIPVDQENSRKARAVLDEAETRRVGQFRLAVRAIQFRRSRHYVLSPDDTATTSSM